MLFRIVFHTVVVPEMGKPKKRIHRPRRRAVPQEYGKEAMIAAPTGVLAAITNPDQNIRDLITANGI